MSTSQRAIMSLAGYYVKVILAKGWLIYLCRPWSLPKRQVSKIPNQPSKLLQA